MKAISLVKPKQIEVIDVPPPTLGPEDVLVEMAYAGLCGTDLSSYLGKLALVSYPRIPGHEISGVITEKGKNVPETIAIGNNVTVSPYSNCGTCPSCRQGRFNTCQFNETLGVQRDGAMMDRFAIHYSKIFSSEILSLKELALVEPLSVGYHATNRGRIRETDMVLVLGSGTIGMGVIVAAKRKGATVIALDVDGSKLSKARIFGADHTINSKEQDAKAEIAGLTNNEGVDVAVEAVGLPETYRLAIESVAYAGRVVYLGYSKQTVTFDTTDFVRKELDILGSRNALRVFPSVIKMLEKRERPFLDLISKVYPFEETGTAFSAWVENPADFIKIMVASNHKNGESE